jgi:hypothetical protein
MKRSRCDQRPLFGAWLAWQELPEDTRQDALDVLTALYLEFVDLSHGETETDDPSDH